MIEIVYHTSEDNGENVVVKPPKNIRQIGSPRGRHKIYVEDYVHTFLHTALFFGQNEQRAAILLGRSEVSQEIRYTFIEGAINCEEFVFQREGIVFDERCWEYIYQEMKQYFDQQSIVGWFVCRAGFPVKLSPVIEAAHRKYFSGRDKVLYLREPEEGEDVFFAYEQGALQKKEGYYIYYEKNLSMQEYMVCQREKNREEQGGIQELTEKTVFSEEPEGLLEERLEQELKRELQREGAAPEEPKQDRAQGEAAESASEVPQGWESEGKADRPERTADAAIEHYRAMLRERVQKQHMDGKNVFLYTMATAAMIALCISGVTSINSYQKMRELESVMLQMSEPLKEQQNGRQITVQTIPGQMDSQEESAGEGLPQEGSGTEGAQGDGADPNGSAQPQPQGAEGVIQPQEGVGDGQPQGSQQGGEQGAGEEGQPQGSADDANLDEETRRYLEQGYYVVQPGDRLLLICRRFYHTDAMLDKLCEANQIEDVDKIVAGQKLILP